MKWPRPPCMDWARTYTRETLWRDVAAAAIVTVLVIPQSLAYALLAGLPPEAGLYASIVPLIAYALLASSRTLAVGPVAVIALMTAAALEPVAASGTTAYAEAALTLALLSGLMLTAFSWLRFGFLANFLSHPVVTGFVTAAAVLIALGQLYPLLGMDGRGHDAVALLSGLVRGVTEVHSPTAAVGLGAVIALLGARYGLAPALRARGFSQRRCEWAQRAAPVGIVVVAGGISGVFGLSDQGVETIGPLPGGLPPLVTPGMDPGLIRDLLLPAALISLVGFVESISVARGLAARRRERVNPDRELAGLGAANVASAFTGGMPVSGGFSRSAVNVDAGAATPAAGAFTAVGIALVSVFLTPWFEPLPIAALAAVILVAVLSLVNGRDLQRIARFSRHDAATLVITLLATLVLGVEWGIAIGVVVSLATHLYRTSRPHTAILGRVPGTEHFRNVTRYSDVEVDPAVAVLRFDESLYFANAGDLEDRVLQVVAQHPSLKHLILVCTGINDVDASGVESLEAIDERLAQAGVLLHLADVKGPVMDRLQGTALGAQLETRTHLSTHRAWSALTGR